MRPALSILLLLSCWLGAADALAAPPAPTRLAIWAPDPAVRPAADLLTATLSRERSLAVLERNELQRIVAEQHLAAGDYLKAGTLLGADGVCVLERLAAGGTNLLVSRVVAVKTGVVLSLTSQPWPVGDLAGWQQWHVTRLARLQPKLQVARTQAVAVSLLNLRAALPGAANAEQERMLTALLTERLAAQPELFVLERRQLDQMAWEKQLLGADDAFWKGGVLLDGTIDRDGVKPDVMTVHLRLQPPGGAPPVLLEAAGARSKPLLLIEKLAGDLVRALKLNPGTAWNPAQEGERYAGEAAWALKWGMLREAQMAAESAWALGWQSSDTAALRLRCYLAEANGPGTSMPPTRPEINAALRSLELTAFHLDNTDWLNPTNSRFWADLAPEALRVCSRPLLRAQSQPHSQAEFGPALADLRKLCRQVDLRLRSRENDKLPMPARADAEFTFGALWQDTPDAAMTLYRRVFGTRLTREFSTRSKPIDGRTLAATLPPVWLPGWTLDDRLRRNQAWYGFLDELCQSTNPVARLEARYVRCLQPVPIDDPTNNFHLLLAACGDNQRAFFENESALACFESLANKMAMHSPARTLDGSQRVELASFLASQKPAFDQYRADLATHAATKAAGVTKEFMDYLQTATTYDGQKFDKLSRAALETATSLERIAIYEALVKFPARFAPGQIPRNATTSQEFFWRVKLPPEYRATLDQAQGDQARAAVRATEEQRVAAFKALREALSPGGKPDAKVLAAQPVLTVTESRELQALLAAYKKRGGDAALVQRLEEHVQANLLSLPELFRFLKLTPTHDAAKFQSTFGVRDFTPQEARALIQPLKEYLNRAVQSPAEKLRVSNLLERLRKMGEVK